MKHLAKYLISAAALVLATACGNIKHISYFQDSTAESAVVLPEVQTITIGVADKLSIVVTSKDPVLAAIFNLPVVSHSAASDNGSGFGNTNQRISTYTVDSDGNIDFPILGRLHVLGLRREDIANLVKNEIIRNDYIKDPVVTVEFANLYVSVLGDVTRPGRYQLDKDRMTVLDAISAAGDLSITGKRVNVKVYREMDGRQVCYSMDLTSANSVFASPAYYLRQNDVIYVEPNKVKARQSTVNGNNVLSTSFWVSAGSLLTSISSLVITAINLKKK